MNVGTFYADVTAVMPAGNIRPLTSGSVFAPTAIHQGVSVFISFRTSLLALAAACVFALPASAQVTPAAPYAPPDDTPTIKVGATIFTDYTFQSAPEVKDADGNVVKSNGFDVKRAYINVTGNISHYLAYRITPDIARESGTGSSLAGSLTFRLKYAFAQVNLDDWMPKGSWVRLGIQQTPWVDFEEGLYRYRFQGTIFMDRESYLSSSDAGVSFHTAFPKNYGDVHAGFYNGETYSKPEANDQKAFMIRGTVRPLPMSRYLRGLRLSGFWDHDAYVKDAERRRALFAVTYEHKYVNAAWQLTDQKDQASVTKATVDGKGWSAWVTPKTTKGFEGLLRFDHLEPSDTLDARRDRTIAGIAYWLPHQGNVSSAFLLDFEQVKNKDFVPAQARQQRVALHALVNF